jgi:hypothetical protein
MPTIKPLRDIDQHDVLNQFKFNLSGAVTTAEKGTFVRILSGVMYDQNLASLGSVGAAYSNTVSQRYGVNPSVVACNASGDLPIGMLLYDTREYDENGEKLLFHPDKAAQMQISLSGQPTPILTKGWVVYSGVQGSPVAGQPAYLHSDGGLVAAAAGATVTATRVGTFLGPKDANGFVYLKINL